MSFLPKTTNAQLFQQSTDRYRWEQAVARKQKSSRKRPRGDGAAAHDDLGELEAQDDVEGKGAEGVRPETKFDYAEEQMKTLALVRHHLGMANMEISEMIQGLAPTLTLTPPNPHHMMKGLTLTRTTHHSPLTPHPSPRPP